MADWKPVRLTAMHHQHIAMGATMITVDGWERPSRFKPVEEEVHQLRTNIGLLDISPLGKLNIQGDDAEALMHSICPGMTLPNIGQACQLPADTAPYSGQVTLARLAQDDFLALTGPNQGTPFSEALEAATVGCAHLFDLSSAMGGARITGPSARLLLAAITEFDCSQSSFPNMACAQIKAAEIHGTIVRADLGDLPSYQLFFGRDFGEYMWETLLEAVQQYGGGPVGLEAMDLLQGD